MGNGSPSDDHECGHIEDDSNDDDGDDGDDDDGEFIVEDFRDFAGWHYPARAPENSGAMLLPENPDLLTWL